MFHDQSFDIGSLVRHLDQNADAIGLDTDVFTFQAGPLIRQEKGYALMNRHFRGRIFDRMMTFARKVDFRFHCLDVDKKFITSALQIATRLKSELEDFLSTHKAEINSPTW